MPRSCLPALVLMRACAQAASWPADISVAVNLSVAQFQNTLCATGADMGIKVYGPDDPPNTAHPAGTLGRRLEQRQHGIALRLQRHLVAQRRAGPCLSMRQAAPGAALGYVCRDRYG